MRISLIWTVFSRLLVGLLVLTSVGRADDEDAVLTSVFSKTDRKYRRFKEPNGKWERQYYAMVNGGPVAGTIRDNAQKSIPFASLAAVVAEHLARQRYLPATNPEKVDLLLVVNWGRTMPFSDPNYRDGLKNVADGMNTVALKNQAATSAKATAAGATQTDIAITGTVETMEAQVADSYLQNEIIMQGMNIRSRNQANARTATLLGYMGEINQADGPQRYAGAGDRYNDLVAEIEEARYYIILSVYDFKRTVRENKPKPLWVTRMSMRAHDNSFAENAATMIASSAHRFGRNSNGLERTLYPKYGINLEEVRFLGLVGGGRPEYEPALTEGK